MVRELDAVALGEFRLHLATDDPREFMWHGCGQRLHFSQALKYANGEWTRLRSQTILLAADRLQLEE
jgi:hypothetical protein